MQEISWNWSLVAFAMVCWCGFPLSSPGQSEAWVPVKSMQDSTWHELFRNLRHAEVWMDSIENWPGGLPDTIQAVTCNHRGIAADLSGDLRAAASAFEQAVNLFESAPHSQARARRNLAMACATLEDYGRAIEEMVAVLDFWTERGDLVMEGKSFCTLSNIYMLNGNWEEATVAMLTGLALLEANPEGQSITIAIEKGNLAGHYFNTGDFEQAADMYLASAAQLWAADRREQAAQTEMNAINVLSFVGDTARISDQLQRLKFRLRQQPVSSARSLGWLASLEAISAPQDSSYVPKLAQVWDEHGAVMDGGRSHVFAWVNALALLGDTLQALAVLDRVERERPDLVGGFRPDLSSFATLKAQLSPSKLGDALLATQQEAHKRMNLKSGILRGQFAHQQLKSDNAQLEKLRQQERRTFYVLVGALVLLLFTIWVLMLLKGARRERDLVQAQTQHHLAGQALQKERRDLALQTLQFAELQKQIGAQVERLDEYNVSRELTSKLRDLSAFETSESQFYKRFEGVFPGFESRMRERFPEITAAEFGLACLILLGLSNGEIASVLHVTQSGVLSRTFRLRKRLGISKDVSLIEYLTTL